MTTRNVQPAAAGQTPGNVPTGQLSVSDLKYLTVHLDAEEAALVSMKKLLEVAPLNGANAAAIREFRKRADATAARNEQIVWQRQLVFRHLSQLLAMPPHEVNISCLLRRCSPEARVVLQPARSRLLRIVSQMQFLSQTMAWILNESREINQLLLEHITGVLSSDRYDAHGQRSSESASMHIGVRS